MRLDTSALFFAAALSAGCAASSLPLADCDAPAMAGDAFLSPRLAAAVPGESRDRRIGVRGGLLIPGQASDQAYWLAGVVGAFYPSKFESLFGLETVPWEAGLDFIVYMPSYDGQLNAGLIRLRMDCLFSFWEWGAVWPKPDFYVLGGLHVSTTTWEAAGETVWGPNLGVGLAWPEKAWDARVAVSLLWGSKNVPAFLLLTGAYTF